MYTKICVDTIGEFSFDGDNDELPFGYGKTEYGFLIDAYNSAKELKAIGALIP